MAMKLSDLFDRAKAVGVIVSLCDDDPAYISEAILLKALINEAERRGWGYGYNQDEADYSVYENDYDHGFVITSEDSLEDAILQALESEANKGGVEAEKEEEG